MMSSCGLGKAMQCSLWRQNKKKSEADALTISSSDRDTIQWDLRTGKQVQVLRLFMLTHLNDEIFSSVWHPLFFHF